MEEPQRTSARLKGKRTLNTADESNTAKRKATPAEASRAYRRRLKEGDPVVYARHRKRENLRVKLFMLNLSEEKRKAYNEKTNARVKRHRTKKKAEGTLKPTKAVTRKAKLEQNAIWTAQKRKQYANETVEQKNARNARRRQRYAELHPPEPKKQEVSTPPSEAPTDSPPPTESQSEDNFQSRVKLPYFWCNFCPYNTESRPSLLQHVATQHCFRCRHCAFVAFSRSQVVQHSLRLHSAFQKQARQQKLKGCQLLRKAFHDNFSPEPVSERRSGSKDTAVGKSTSGAGPSKRQMLEESHRLWCVDQEEAFHVQMDDNSSSTDSSDDNCLPDREHQLALSHTNSINSACTSSGDDCRLVIKTESLSENIVSSSNMDVDTDVDARPSIFSEPGQTNTDWESASDRETLQMTCDTDTGEPQVVIKQEAEDEDEFSFVVQENIWR